MFGFEAFEQRGYGEQIQEGVEKADVGDGEGVQTVGCMVSKRAL